MIVVIFNSKTGNQLEESSPVVRVGCQDADRVFPLALFDCCDATNRGVWSGWAEGFGGCLCIGGEDERGRPRL